MDTNTICYTGQAYNQKTKLKFEFGHTPLSFDRVMAPFSTQNSWKVAEALGSPNGIYLYSTWK